MGEEGGRITHSQKTKTQNKSTKTSTLTLGRVNSKLQPFRTPRLLFYIIVSDNHPSSLTQFYLPGGSGFSGGGGVGAFSCFLLLETRGLFSEILYNFSPGSLKVRWLPKVCSPTQKRSPAGRATAKKRCHPRNVGGSGQLAASSPRGLEKKEIGLKFPDFCSYAGRLLYLKSSVFKPSISTFFFLRRFFQKLKSVTI